MQSSTDRLARVISLFDRVKQFVEKGTYLSPPSASFRSPFPSRPLLSASVVAQNRKFSSHFIQRNNESLVFENGDTRARQEGALGGGGAQEEIKVYRKRQILFSPRELFVAQRRRKDVQTLLFRRESGCNEREACGYPAGDTRQNGEEERVMELTIDA